MVDELDPSRRREIRERAFDAMYRNETWTEVACRDCGKPFADKPWERRRTIGHNIPLSRVREGEIRELVKYDQCAGCNSRQRTRTPEEWRAALRSGGLEPVDEITEEQKRSGERARFEWYRRHHPEVAVPQHLLTHDETFDLALAKARERSGQWAQQVAEAEDNLASRERALELMNWSRLTDFFMLLSNDPRGRRGGKRQEARMILANRDVLERMRALLSGEQARTRQLEVDGRLAACPCSRCAGDYDERSALHRMELREEYRWGRSRPSPRLRQPRAILLSETEADRDERSAPAPVPQRVEQPSTWKCRDHDASVSTVSPKGRPYRYCPVCGAIGPAA